MKVLKFKCTLLTDVILNQKASTEGSNTTLDFIPGNNFLGIVAKNYNKFSPEVFHSGKVRFGDAHPVVEGHEGIRSVRVPASMYYPKLQSPEEACYIHHAYDAQNDTNKPQLKQCRKGFYVFETDKGYPAITESTFALKSAYDREKRRAKDEQMFGYESLDAGLAFLFEVECDNDEFAAAIQDSLIGKHRIGRSRSAQYGLVEIEKSDFKSPAGSREVQHDYVTVYADGRLIFLDENGTPTFRPTAKDLGLEDGEIDWGKTQLRTFQYAPWNYKRQCRDTDRVGIEKGSVFVVKTQSPAPAESAYVGSYRNEGFGRVIYNPDFLQVKPDSNGVAKYTLEPKQVATKQELQDNSANTPLLALLRERKQAEETDKEILERVNEFVKKYKSMFSGETFASQWGTIRSIAMGEVNEDKLWSALFAPETGYLTHGTAKDKWDKWERRNVLKEKFAKENKGHLRKAIINLASEMAKIKK